MRRKMYGRALWRLVALVVLMGFPAARGEPLLFVNDFDGFVAAAGGTVTTIDFETLPDGSATFRGQEITPEVNFTPLGVTFSSAIPELTIHGFPGIFELRALNDETSTRNWIIAEFDPPVRAVGVLLPRRTVLSAFNNGNGLIASLAHGFGGGGDVFLGIVSENPIYRVIGDDNSEIAEFTDFHFAPVPEPTTLLLLAGGGVALILRRRLG